MSSISIFISYSHKDEDWKDRVATHLRVLEMESMLEVWDDRRIEAGDDWFSEIEKVINRVNIAILLISANFLTSKFIRDEEISRLLMRREKEGVRIIPLIIKPCAWTQVKWLSAIQARPKDGRALSMGSENQIDTDLAALAIEIAGIVKRASVADIPIETRSTMPLPPEKISLAKLPSISPDLFGRKTELKELDDAWADPHINVVSLVAWGGVGKSALVSKWLSQMARDNFRGAEQVFGWSFYSQGASEGRQVSADQFIATALTWFGDSDPNVGSPWDKGERLAELVKQSRALLILDGLEPLQNPPPIETGRIKDPALVSFLREMMRQNRGLVVISTRLAVDDLKDCVGDTVIERNLDNLSFEAGVEYLSHLGVEGSNEELRNAVKEFSGHALALTLMGHFLVDAYDGDVRKRDLIPHLTDEEEKGNQAKQIMQAYEKWFEGKPEYDLLTIIGLFDRPAEKGALDALLATPIIDGLTNHIQGLSAEKYKLVIKHLRNARLLSGGFDTSLVVAHDHSNTKNNDELDCHPLLREYFGGQLKKANLAAWREGNNRLYEYYIGTAKELPDTLQEMTPLFNAVMHGCQAGKYQEALNIYQTRIQRGGEFFNRFTLGAYSANLSTLSAFFDDKSWLKPVDGLNERSKNFVLSDAAFDLHALGRLTESAESLKAGLEKSIQLENFRGATTDAGNLSELYMTIGDIAQSLFYAKRSAQLADEFMRRISITELMFGYSHKFSQIYTHTLSAHALHQAGHLDEANALFCEAEEIQKEEQPKIPFLYGIAGFRYCDLLLEQGNYASVEKRASATLGQLEHEHERRIVDKALDYLCLGRAYLFKAQYESNLLFFESLTYLNLAVDGLRQAGNQSRLPFGLLARAECYRIKGTLDKAQRDLDEAFTISKRGGMGLFLVDCHLEYAWLYLAKRVKDKAREHWAIAKERIEEMGYHRRDKDITNLATELK